MFWSALPGAISLGLIWGLMAIGVCITYKVLDFADLTVDGSICTGGAVCAVLMASGVNAWAAIIVAIIAGALAGLVTGIFHTLMGIPAILSGILTQLILWSVNLKIMGQANQVVDSRGSYVIVSQLDAGWSILIMFGFLAVIIAERDRVRRIQVNGFLIEIQRRLKRVSRLTHIIMNVCNAALYDMAVLVFQVIFQVGFKFCIEVLVDAFEFTAYRHLNAEVAQTAFRLYICNTQLTDDNRIVRHEIHILKTPAVTLQTQAVDRDRQALCLDRHLELRLYPDRAVSRYAVDRPRGDRDGSLRLAGYNAVRYGCDPRIG